MATDPENGWWWRKSSASIDALEALFRELLDLSPAGPGHIRRDFRTCASATSSSASAAVPPLSESRPEAV